MPFDVESKLKQMQNKLHNILQTDDITTIKELTEKQVIAVKEIFFKVYSDLQKVLVYGTKSDVNKIREFLVNVWNFLEKLGHGDGLPKDFM